MTWIERGTPPGWAVSEIGRNHQRPTRVWWSRCVGQAYYLETEEDAHRVAWERWACSVLGDLLWLEYTDEDAMTGAKTHVLAVRPPEDEDLWAWRETSHHEATYLVEGDSRPNGFHRTCPSPVGALVRLAGLKLACLPRPESE